MYDNCVEHTERKKIYISSDFFTVTVLHVLVLPFSCCVVLLCLNDCINSVFPHLLTDVSARICLF